MSSAQLRMLAVPVEVVTLHSLQLATVAFLVLSFAAKLFSRSRKVGKALPTPGGMFASLVAEARC